MDVSLHVTKWIGIVALVGVTAAVCNNPTQSTQAGGSNPTTGLTGTVKRWPVMPVCQENVPCDGPYVATFEVLQNDRRVATFQTDSTGTFTVRLRPGSYVVRPTDSQFMGNQTKSVTVQAQGLTQVQLVFDTGIR